MEGMEAKRSRKVGQRTERRDAANAIDSGKRESEKGRC